MLSASGDKIACQACVRGHRVSGCTHTMRELKVVNKKGRPVTQCADCKNNRKSRGSSGKCDCGEKSVKCIHIAEPVKGHTQTCCINHGTECSCCMMPVCKSEDGETADPFSAQTPPSPTSGEPVANRRRSSTSAQSSKSAKSVKSSKSSKSVKSTKKAQTKTKAALAAMGQPSSVEYEYNQSQTNAAQPMYMRNSLPYINTNGTVSATLDTILSPGVGPGSQYANGATAASNGVSHDPIFGMLPQTPTPATAAQSSFLGGANVDNFLGMMSPQANFIGCRNSTDSDVSPQTTFAVPSTPQDSSFAVAMSPQTSSFVDSMSPQQSFTNVITPRTSFASTMPFANTISPPTSYVDTMSPQASHTGGSISAQSGYGGGALASSDQMFAESRMARSQVNPMMFPLNTQITRNSSISGGNALGLYASELDYDRYMNSAGLTPSDSWINSRLDSPTRPEFLDAEPELSSSLSTLAGTTAHSSPDYSPPAEPSRNGSIDPVVINSALAASASAMGYNPRQHIARQMSQSHMLQQQAHLQSSMAQFEFPQSTSVSIVGSEQYMGLTGEYGESLGDCVGVVPAETTGTGLDYMWDMSAQY